MKMDIRESTYYRALRLAEHLPHTPTVNDLLDELVNEAIEKRKRELSGKAARNFSDSLVAAV